MHDQIDGLGWWLKKENLSRGLFEQQLWQFVWEVGMRRDLQGCLDTPEYLNESVWQLPRAIVCFVEIWEVILSSDLHF